ncbi:MAG: hypothetical protein ACW98K_00035 [Candidatus Kariarchaeaceae archaeon]
MKDFPVHLKRMEKHMMFDIHISDEDGYEYVIFDFSLTPKIYSAVKKGSYSSIDGNARTILTITGGQLVQLGLSPEVFYEDFAEQFEYPIELIRANKDLVSAPDVNNEYLNLTKKTRDIVIDAY